MQIRCLALAGLLASGLAVAQDTRTTTYETDQGTVHLTWGQPAARDFGAPPAFDQLARMGTISESDAASYPPLANDFIHADRNRDGRISRTEYERWTGAR